MESPGKQRIRLTVHYDGAGFLGWQLQPRGRTVQGEMERVVSRLLNVPTRVTGSGRTDRGVHATGQVAAVDVPVRWTPVQLRRAMNALLPQDLWIASAEAVAPRFHPRFDAQRRSYIYRVGTAEEALSPFHARWCWPLARELDRERMERAAAILPGEHSFRAFAKSGQEERGDRCTVVEARWTDWAPLGVELHISANRFLHHMVRYLVGTMVEIGLGRRDPEEMTALLEPGMRQQTSPPAPPEGLYLTAVEYPADALDGSSPRHRWRETMDTNEPDDE